VVEADEGELRVMPAGADHEENANGPEAEAEIEIAVPESYQPSAVGLVPRVPEYDPPYVVVRVQRPPALPPISFPETLAPEQVVDE